MQGEEIDSDAEESSAEASAAALDDQAAAQEQPAEGAESSISAEALAARYSKVFAVGTTGPSASGLPQPTQTATKALVKLAAAHINGLKKADIDVLSKAGVRQLRPCGWAWLAAR